MTKNGDPKKVFKVSETTRLIPSVTLNAASSVGGNVVAGTTSNNPNIAALNTELQSFFTNVVYAKNYQGFATQTLNQALTFSDTLSFTTLGADVLNGIPVAKIILRNSGVTQVIDQEITLNQAKLPILGSLTTSTINGIDLTQTEVDILLKDRAETISARPMTSFTKDVTVSTNEITIDGENN